MTQQKKGMPFVISLTKSTQNSTRDRYVQIVGKYTNYTIEIPLNFEIVLINGMEAVSK
jgi:hypothetical protein